MANNSKNTKNIIIGICAAVVVIVVVVVAIILGTKKGGITGLNDSFFVSDGSKLVVDVDAESVFSEDEQYIPKTVRLVYYYKGDSVTGLEAYYEYADEEIAKAAFNYLSKSLEGEYKSISQDRVYVIVEANEEEYLGTTTDDVKQQIEFIESIKAMEKEDEEAEDTSDIENVDFSKYETDGEEASAENPEE